MSDKKVIRIGMVGVAKRHTNAIVTNDKVKFAAVADINEDTARMIGDEFDVPYYTDYKKMADEIELDAVILNLPHYLHCEVSVFFLERNIHVLCEKPMAITLEECDRMIAAAERSEAKLAIGHNTRQTSANKCIKKFIEEKTLGELCMHTEIRTCSYFDDSRPKWFLDKKLSGGGILMNYGAHSFETIMNVTGGKITDIDADIANLMNKDGVEAHAMIKFKIDGRIPCCITFGGYSLPDKNEKIYYFTKGALMQTLSGLFISDTPGGEFRPYEVDNKNAFTVQLEEFIKYINNEECDIVDGAAGRKIIEIINEVYSQNS